MFSKKPPFSVASLLIGVVAFALAAFSGYVTATAPLFALVLLAAFLAAGGAALAYLRAAGISAHDRHVASFVFLFWAWVVNVPAFYAFDPQGIVRADIINPQSLSRIAFFGLIALGVAGFLVVSGRQAPEPGRPTPRWYWLPGAIFGWYLLDAFVVLRGQDLLLAVYRVGEWALLLVLVAVIVNRAPPDPAGREDWLLGVGAAVMLFQLLAVFVVLPLAPSRVYFVGMTGIGRLGSPFAHPNVLGVLAGMSFFYFVSKASRVALIGALVSLGVLVATYSRGAWLGFAVACAAYFIGSRRTPGARIVALLLLGGCAALLWGVYGVFEDSILRIVSRGASVENVLSASERTEVWRAARVLIREEPILGHGFAAGPKKLNDLMAAGPTGAYFRAIHAHNDFVQTQISGGAIATLLLALLAARTIYLCFLVSRSPTSRFSRVTIAWLLQIWIYGLLTFVVSGPITILGALLLYLYACLEIVVSARRAGALRAGTKPVGERAFDDQRAGETSAKKTPRAAFS